MRFRAAAAAVGPSPRLRGARSRRSRDRIPPRRRGTRPRASSTRRPRRPPRTGCPGPSRGRSGSRIFRPRPWRPAATGRRRSPPHRRTGSSCRRSRSGRRPPPQRSAGRRKPRAVCPGPLRVRSRKGPPEWDSRRSASRGAVGPLPRRVGYAAPRRSVSRSPDP